ncbi:hypothetical protein ETAE_1688 [Edwardsiella piscicida]|uniref:Uncharacterized protein n=1 Tax=Edwardsiella piscicida TaxID=1263550 RepID=A0AAU8P3H7_EDWPI|nr:hypothetical protein ETAE_1688 [Edwardsiella tarda EIB202]
MIAACSAEPDCPYSFPSAVTVRPTLRRMVDLFLLLSINYILSPAIAHRGAG